MFEVYVSFCRNCDPNILKINVFLLDGERLEWLPSVHSNICWFTFIYSLSLLSWLTSWRPFFPAISPDEPRPLRLHALSNFESINLGKSRICKGTCYKSEILTQTSTVECRFFWLLVSTKLTPLAGSFQSIHSPYQADIL